MTAVGSYIDKFSRKYLYLNPDPTLGPGTWRLSNVPAFDDGDINTIENLYAVPPIYNDQVGETANLKFVIESVPDINAARSTTNLSSSINGLLQGDDLIPLPGSTLFNLGVINGVAPIMTRQEDRNAFVWFNIDSLPNVDTARNPRRIEVTLGTFGYNSRSVTSITATAPLKAATSADIATVSFDITTLPDA
jgi:hypothetical protein